MASTPRVRKNIDTLTPEELEDYKHAIAKLREISAADPESFDGYTYLEQLHDGDKGPCEHANDTFLPWHRAHLWVFEEALRRVDPPRTANVTIPYWDWSVLPSGKRYPKAFEDQSSILFEARNSAPVCRQPGQTGCQQLPFPRDYIEQSLLSNPLWSAPVPTPPVPPDPSFGGVAGGESDCSSPFGKGMSAVESPAHNAMHGNFIGGFMADPASAALDPIFWSFHAYIDLFWWQWQQVAGHSVNTGHESRLCGLYKDHKHLPENRFRVRDVLDTVPQLDVAYEYTRPEVPAAPPVPGQLFKTHPAIDFVMSAVRPPELTRSLDVEIPTPGFETARLDFTGVKVHTSFSYGADIFLVPADEPFQPQDRTFRERYLVDFLYMWKAHQHGGHSGHVGHDGHDMTHDIAVDVTDALRSLAASQPGRRWKVWIALAAAQAPAPPHHHMDALSQGHVLAKGNAADTAQRLNFNGVELRIR